MDARQRSTLVPARGCGGKWCGHRVSHKCCSMERGALCSGSAALGCSMDRIWMEPHSSVGLGQRSGRHKERFIEPMHVFAPYNTVHRVRVTACVVNHARMKGRSTNSIMVRPVILEWVVMCAGTWASGGQVLGSLERVLALACAAV
jgi:hypothetical protein